jgi:hypothetical protein
MSNDCTQSLVSSSITVLWVGYCSCCCFSYGYCGNVVAPMAAAPVYHAPARLLPVATAPVPSAPVVATPSEAAM